MNILHVCADPQPMEEAASKQIAAAFFAQIVMTNEDARITNVDLTMEPPAEYTMGEYRNFWYPIMIEGYVPTKEEEHAGEYASGQAAKVLDSDVLVLTMPMWNYSMPGMLKSWIDHVLSPGLLYEATAEGNRPLHKLKKLVLLVSSQDVFKEGDPRDGITPTIETAFSDVGLDDISIIWADGQDSKKHVDFQQRKQNALDFAEELAEEVCDDFARA